MRSEADSSRGSRGSGRHAGGCRGSRTGRSEAASRDPGRSERSFVLTPLTPGAIKRDTGTASFCCWSQRHIMRDGQAIDINDPR